MTGGSLAASFALRDEVLPAQQADSAARVDAVLHSIAEQLYPALWHLVGHALSTHLAAAALDQRKAAAACAPGAPRHHHQPQSERRRLQQRRTPNYDVA